MLQGAWSYEVTAHQARESPSRWNSKLVAKKGAHYNLHELQPLHEGDMTATATTSRYAYLFYFRQNVSNLQFACFCLKNGAVCELWFDFEKLR